MFGRSVIEVWEHAAVDERMVAAGRVSLAVAEAGTGGRPLLLLHGFTGAKEDFAEWLDPLAEAGWHAVAPDLRGHGASDKPTGEDAYSFELLATDAVGLTDALGWDRYCLLGHSMGGMVAQYVVLADPGRLNGLVLMDTGHGALAGLDTDQVQAALAVVRTRGIDALADLLEGRESPLETEAHRRLLAERSGYAEFQDRKLRSTAPSLYAAMVQEIAGAADRLPALASLPADLPVLVMVGEQDAPFVEASEQMAAAIPGASLARIPNAGHSPQFENPTAWWSTLTGFLDDLPST